MMEGVDGVVGLVHALKRVGYVVVDGQLRGEWGKKGTKIQKKKKQNAQVCVREKSQKTLALAYCALKQTYPWCTGTRETQRG